MKTLTVMALAMLTASVSAEINVPHPLNVVQPLVVRACTNMGLAPSGVIDMGATTRLDFTREYMLLRDRVVQSIQLVLIGEGDATRIEVSGRMLWYDKYNDENGITHDGGVVHNDSIDVPVFESRLTDAINAAWR